MPISTEEQLLVLQDEVRAAIAKADTDAALASLLEMLPSNRPKHNQVLLLASRQREYYAFEIDNRLSVEELDIQRNELRHDILLFIDHLSLVDFSEAAPPRPELKPGHLLYKVPPQMAVRQPYECVVRVAHELEQVLEGLDVDASISLEEVAVAEIMEVSVIDPSPEDDRAFDILLLSDGEQLVDAYSYTEWVFNVRPLKEGSYQLILKVSVILMVNGKERTKNMVLRREIAVSATALSEEVPLLRVVEATTKTTVAAGPSDDTQPQAPCSPRMVGGAGASATEFIKRAQAAKPPIAPPEPASKPRTANRRQLLRVAASVLVLFFAGWWLVTTGLPNNIDRDEGATNSTDTAPETETQAPSGTASGQFELKILDDTIRSPRKALSGTIDSIAVEINYGSPSVRGRVVYGELVPYGQIWRAGANEATQITFAEDVLLGADAHLLPAGTYALFYRPASKLEWTVVFNKVADQWGAYDHDAGEDALRLSAKAHQLDQPKEELDFGLLENLVLLRWGDVEIAFAVSAAR